MMTLRSSLIINSSIKKWKIFRTILGTLEKLIMSWEFFDRAIRFWLIKSHGEMSNLVIKVWLKVLRWNLVKFACLILLSFYAVLGNFMVRLVKRKNFQPKVLLVLVFNHKITQNLEISPNLTTVYVKIYHEFNSVASLFTFKYQVILISVYYWIAIHL